MSTKPEELEAFIKESLVDKPDEVLEKMDRMLKVSNVVEDNELGGTDLAVSVDWKQIKLSRPNKWLRSGEAELCSARWGAAFLCEFGHYWDSAHQYGDSKSLDQLFSSCSKSLLSLRHVTFPVNNARSEIRSLLGYDSQKRGVYRPLSKLTQMNCTNSTRKCGNGNWPWIMSRRHTLQMMEATALFSLILYSQSSTPNGWIPPRWKRC